MIRAAAAALLAQAAAFAATAWAAPPSLSLPLDCRLGETCFIQQYMDHDPGPGARDWQCRGLSYDGHKGTDFRLPDRAAMRAGVAVRAAAPGIVTALRDGMPDNDGAATDPPTADGRDCGNGVVIDHGDGWQTQYCHLRRGSLRVQRGSAVARGAALGLVGLSGRTQFPHLHLSLRHDGRPVDPFAPDGAACPADAAAGATLWATPLPYQPGGILAAGVLPHLPDYAEVRAGPPRAESLPPDAPALVLWAFVFGVEPGDRLKLHLEGPGGTVVADETLTLDRRQAQLYRAAGRRRPATGWPPGDYRAEVRHLRDGTVIGSHATALRVAP